MEPERILAEGYLRLNTVNATDALRFASSFAVVLGVVMVNAAVAATFGFTTRCSLSERPFESRAWRYQ